MTQTDSDNYVRCHQAIQELCKKSIPCIRMVLETWHQQVKSSLSSCTTPQICGSIKGKANDKKGCQACVDWANALELATYWPPNTSGTLAWTNVNPTLLHKDPVEAAKAFVLRLPAGTIYSDVGDFDAASLLMIMMKFKEFNQGDQSKYQTIKKVKKYYTILWEPWFSIYQTCREWVIPCIGLYKLDLNFDKFPLRVENYCTSTWFPQSRQCWSKA